MKSKKLLIIFLCLVLILINILPIKIVFALDIGQTFCNIVKWLPPPTGSICEIAQVIKSVASGNIFKDIANEIAKGLAAVFNFLAKIFHGLIFWFNRSVLAPIINGLSTLNPFEDKTYIDSKGRSFPAPSPIGILWNIFRNFAYIVLVFSALSAGFQWLMGQDESAKRLIFNIIVVALLINFTFVLIKESFFIVRSLENGLTGGQSGQIGSLLVASLWQRDPVEEISTITKESGLKTEDVLKALAEAAGYIFIIMLDMIIFMVLFVSAVLFILRYINLILLAGVSPLAVASITLPEFRAIRGLESFSGFNFFNGWLTRLVNWILVVPIFVILIILGNVLTNNVLGQMISGTSGSDPLRIFFEFIIIFLVLVNWYIIALKVANNLSGNASKWAAGMAMAGLMIAGGLGAAGFLAMTRGGIGSALTKAGDFLIEKAPAKRFTFIGRFGKATRDLGKRMIERQHKPGADVVEAKLELYREKLEKATKDEEIANISKNISDLVQQFKNNPYILGIGVNQIDRLSAKNFEKIATNKDAISALLSPDLPDEAIEKIRKKVTGLSDKTKLKILTDENLLPVYQQSAKIKADFLEEIGKIDSGKMIEALSQAKSEVIQQITKDSELQNAINKSTKGLFSTLAKGEVKAVADALLNIGEDAFKNFGHIQSIARQVKPELNLIDVLHEGLLVDPNLIFRSAIKSPKEDLRNALRSMDVLKLIDELSPQKGSDTERYMSILYDI